jgi:hypothetical protein
LFSPVASRVRPGERKRADALLWNAWIDASGQVRPLPPHTFIASRATLPSGRRREQHYALVCASSTALTVGTQLRVFPEHLRSVSTGKPLGVAQGAAVVDCVGRAKEQTGRSYPLALSVELEAPYFVRLAQPCVLKARDLADVNNATRAAISIASSSWSRVCAAGRRRTPCAASRAICSTWRRSKRLPPMSRPRTSRGFGTGPRPSIRASSPAICSIWGRPRRPRSAVSRSRASAARDGRAASARSGIEGRCARNDRQRRRHHRGVRKEFVAISP